MSRFPRRARGRAGLALLFAAVALSGCGKDPATPDNPSIAGRWSGTAAFGAVQFEATFDQEGTLVSGNGDFTSPLGSGPFTATGTVVGADVNLALVSSEFGATTYAGRFTGPDRIEGHLQAPNFSDIELVLERD